MANTSKTGKKQGRRGNPKVAEAGKNTRFKKGFDPRRNLKGAPRHFTALREMILDIITEEENKKTQLENVLRNWLKSGDYNKQRTVIEYGYGKVPDESKNLSIIDDFILENIDLFTDGQLLRIQQGEDKSVVVAEVLREAASVLKKIKL